MPIALAMRIVRRAFLLDSSAAAITSATDFSTCSTIDSKFCRPKVTKGSDPFNVSSAVVRSPFSISPGGLADRRYAVDELADPRDRLPFIGGRQHRLEPAEALLQLLQLRRRLFRALLEAARTPGVNSPG